jgi:hypothetical protein
MSNSPLSRRNLSRRNLVDSKSGWTDSDCLRHRQEACLLDRPLRDKCFYLWSSPPSRRCTAGPKCSSCCNVLRTPCPTGSNSAVSNTGSSARGSFVKCCPHIAGNSDTGLVLKAKSGDGKLTGDYRSVRRFYLFQSRLRFCSFLLLSSKKRFLNFMQHHFHNNYDIMKICQVSPNAIHQLYEWEYILHHNLPSFKPF